MNLLETSAFVMIWRRGGERERCCSNKVKLFGQNDVERRKGKRDVCYSTFHFHQDTRSVYIYIYIPQYTSLNEADETGKRIPDRVTRRIERLSPGYVSENSACHPVNAVSRF